MCNEQTYRQLTNYERKIIDHLFKVDFPGRDALVDQINNSLVRFVDENGSLEFLVQTEIMADVKRRIPIEGEVEDGDGIMIHVLLHVVDGRIAELEIYKDDSSSIIKMPDPSTLRPVLLD